MSRVQAFDVAPNEYMKKNGPFAFFDDLREGDRFRIARVQIYFEGPLDFSSIFIKNGGKAIHECSGKSHLVPDTCMVLHARTLDEVTSTLDSGPPDS